MESKSKSPSIAVLIPMFNEEKVAAKCIDAVINVLKKMENKTSLIVVNDGSRDKTATILSSKLKKYNKKLIVETHKRNKGYGAALQTGMKAAMNLGFDWCLHMDSDLTNDPKYIPDFASNIKNDIDCIKASRYIKKSKVLNVPKYRRIISVAGNYLASLVFNVGIRDCTNGFRLVKLEKLKGIRFKENNFSIILEELYYLKKKHAKFKEIPYTLTARTDSKSHFTYKPRIFVDYFKYVVKSFFLSF